MLCCVIHLLYFLAQLSTTLDFRLLFAGTEAQFGSGLLSICTKFDDHPTPLHFHPSPLEYTDDLTWKGI